MQKDADLWEGELTQFFVGGLRKEILSSSETISHLLAVGDVFSLKDQLDLLGSLPNHPKLHYITKQVQKSKTTFVSFYQHLLTNPDMFDDDGVWKVTPGTRTKLPTSPRNRLMLYCLNTEFGLPDERQALLEQIALMLKVDMEMGESISQVRNSAALDAPPDEGTTEPPPKKRRCKTRVLSVSKARVCQHLGQDVQLAKNFASQHRTQYQIFSEAMITDGQILWREHSDEKDVVIMSDYCDSTGVLLPQKFVFVTSRVGDEGVYLIKCTCSTYQQIQCAALIGEADLEADEEVALNSEQMTCMHCRLYRNHMAHQYDLVTADDRAKSNLLSTVHVDVKNPVVLVGSVWPQSATHFSVLGKESLSIVHVTFTPTNCWVTCLNGSCKASMAKQNKKRVPKVISVTDTQSDVCEHLALFYADVKNWKPLFHDYFNSDATDDTDSTDGTDGTDDTVVDPVQDALPFVLNTEDQDVRSVTKHVWFDTEKGLWECKSYTSHTPLDQFDPNLIKATFQRLQTVGGGSMGFNGMYKGPDFIPASTNGDGSPRQCTCGSTYFGGQVKPLPNKTALFTRNVSNPKKKNVIGS